MPTVPARMPLCLPGHRCHAVEDRLGNHHSSFHTADKRPDPTPAHSPPVMSGPQNMRFSALRVNRQLKVKCLLPTCVFLQDMVPAEQEGLAETRLTARARRECKPRQPAAAAAAKNSIWPCVAEYRDGACSTIGSGKSGLRQSHCGPHPGQHCRRKFQSHPARTVLGFTKARDLQHYGRRTMLKPYRRPLEVRAS